MSLLTLCSLMTIAASGLFAQCTSAESFKLPLRRRDLGPTRLNKRATGDVDLFSANSQVNWDVILEVGGQEVTLGLDTGSSPLWMLSTRMSSQNKTAFRSHSIYDPTKSNTFENSSKTFHTAYDKGEVFVSGDVGSDNVTMGGLTANMPIGLATSVSPNLIGDATDGIFGLAFSAANQLGQGSPTFMQAIIPQLDEPVVTFSLPISGHQSMEFGHVSKDLFNGTLQPVAIHNASGSDSLGWQTLVSYSINGKNISSQMQKTVFDTGGITALADDDVVQAYWAMVKGAKMAETNWHFPCDSILPDLTYNLNGVDGSTISATVPGRFFNYTALIQKRYISNDCIGGLNSNGNGQQGTMGWAFWHSYFTVFNMTGPSISIAPYSEKVLNTTKVTIGDSAAPKMTNVPNVVPSSPVSTTTSTAGARGASSNLPRSPGLSAALIWLLVTVGS